MNLEKKFKDFAPLLMLVGFVFGNLSLAARPTEGWSLPDSPLSPKEKAAHLLNRLGFGPRPGDVERLARQGDEGLKQWIEAQLNPEKIENRQLEAGLKKYPVLTLSPWDLRQKYKTISRLRVDLKITNPDPAAARLEVIRRVGEDRISERILPQLLDSRLFRAVASERQLEELLLDFWTNHFRIDARVNFVKFMIPAYDETIRKHLFGKFQEMFIASAQDPAVLHSSGNWASSAEPYRQEIIPVAPLEPVPFWTVEYWRRKFFPAPPESPKLGPIVKRTPNPTLAKALLAFQSMGEGYREEDVLALARILTGWSIADLEGTPSFHFDPRIHDWDEKSFLGERFPVGGALDEGIRALNLLAGHKATAKLIATKLCRYFVSDNPPAVLIDRVTLRLIKRDGNLTEAYRTIFQSPEFWSKESFRAKTKPPLQFLASAMRGLGGLESETGRFAPKLEVLGEPLYQSNDPSGYPDTTAAWNGAGSQVARFRVGLELATYWSQRPFPSRALSRLEKKSKDTAARDLIEQLFPEGLPIRSRQVASTLCATCSKPRRRAEVAGFLLGSPEFQRK